MASEPVWTGKTDVMIALPGATPADPPAPMEKLGEAQDMIDPVEQYFYNDVPGDRHGGPQGAPIERQILSLVMTINLDLSSFDQDVVDKVKKQNVFTTLGSFDLLQVGTFLMLHNAFRLVLKNNKLNQSGVQEASGYNFPCALLAAPIRQPRGTKFTTLSLTFEAHRAPEGHNKAGVVYNTDLDDPQ